VRESGRSLRANARHRFGLALARLIGRSGAATELDPAGISSVLVCRINGRMGNTLFLTPLIRRVHELLPDAAIDLALSYPQAGDLLLRLPGVRRVITFPHKGPNLPGRYLRALKSLRSMRYDLAIDPTPHSTSGRIVLSLCRARYRVGFGTTSQWAPLTHAVPLPDGLTHQAIQPLELMRVFGAAYDAQDVRLWLALQPDELAAGRAAVEGAVAGRMPDQGVNQVFGFFAYATAFKRIEPQWWLAFWKRFLELEPQAVPLEILPTPDSPPTDPRFAALHFPSPRQLTAAISAMRLFICADTGPMHLASSTPVPVVALFCASEPTLYRPLKPCDVVIKLGELSAEAVAQRCQLIWRQSLSASEFGRRVSA
jgi:ADP-heptose:LPS heptosyltransferase